MFEDLISRPAPAHHPKARPGPRQTPAEQKLLREQKLRRQAEHVWRSLSGERHVRAMRDDAERTMILAQRGVRSDPYVRPLTSRPALMATLLRRRAEVLGEGTTYPRRLGRGVADAAAIMIDFEEFRRVPEHFRPEALRRLRVKYNWPAPTLAMVMRTHGHEVG